MSERESTFLLLRVFVFVGCSFLVRESVETLIRFHRAREREKETRNGITVDIVWGGMKFLRDAVSKCTPAPYLDNNDTKLYRLAFSINEDARVTCSQFPCFNLFRHPAGKRTFPE